MVPMDFLMIIVVLLIFLLPSMLMMRGQKKRQRQVQEMQASIAPGDKVVNVAGFHATVVEHNGENLRVELAPGVVVTMETAGVMKRLEAPSTEATAAEPTSAEGEAER